MRGKRKSDIARSDPIKPHEQMIQGNVVDYQEYKEEEEEESLPKVAEDEEKLDDKGIKINLVNY